MNVSITDMALNQSVFLIRSIDHFYVTMPVETTIIALIAMENTDHYDWMGREGCQKMQGGGAPSSLVIFDHVGVVWEAGEKLIKPQKDFFALKMFNWLDIRTYGGCVPGGILLKFTYTFESLIFCEIKS